MKAQSFPSRCFLFNLSLIFLHAFASICNRLRFTVRTSTHLKSSNAHSFPSRLVVALRIVSTAHNHHTTRPLLRHRRCWILEKCWTLLVRQRLPVALGKIDDCLSLGNTLRAGVLKKKKKAMGLSDSTCFLTGFRLIASVWVQHGEIWPVERATSTRSWAT